MQIEELKTRLKEARDSDSCHVAIYLTEQLLAQGVESAWILSVYGRYLIETGRYDDAEEELGWSTMGDIVVSPKIETSIELPVGEFDEWYLFGSKPKPFEPREIYVNRSSFDLRDPKLAQRGLDPCPMGVEELRELQAKFWSDLNRIRPHTIIVNGPRFTVATRDSRIMNWMPWAD